MVEAAERQRGIGVVSLKPGFALRQVCRLVFVMVLILPWANATEAGWEVVKNRTGITVTQRVVDDSPYKATRGVMLSRAGMFAVLAVLGDIEACSDWLHKCRRGRMVEKLSEGDHVYHTVIDSPFFLRDRETYVRSVVSYRTDPPALIIEMTGLEDVAPLTEERVRVLDFTGYWLIEPQSGDQLRITYEVHMNPQAGAVKAANSTMATSVLKTLENVDRLARSARYRDATPPASLRSVRDWPAHP